MSTSAWEQQQRLLQTPRRKTLKEKKRERFSPATVGGEKLAEEEGAAEAKVAEAEEPLVPPFPALAKPEVVADLEQERAELAALEVRRAILAAEVASLEKQAALAGEVAALEEL